GRANVLATRAGTGGGKTLMFNGHLDTSYSGREPWWQGVEGFQPAGGGRGGLLPRGARGDPRRGARRGRARRGRVRRDREDAVRRRTGFELPRVRGRNSPPRHARGRRGHVPARRADRGQGGARALRLARGAARGRRRLRPHRLQRGPRQLRAPDGRAPRADPRVVRALVGRRAERVPRRPRDRLGRSDSRWLRMAPLADAAADERLPRRARPADAADGGRAPRRPRPRAGARGCAPRLGDRRRDLRHRARRRDRRGPRARRSDRPGARGGLRRGARPRRAALVLGRVRPDRVRGPHRELRHLDRPDGAREGREPRDRGPGEGRRGLRPRREDGLRVKLVTYDEGRVGRVDGDELVRLDVRTMREYFERGGADETAERTPLAQARLRAPIRPTKLFHTAGNFREHEEESRTVDWSHRIAPWINFFQNVAAIGGPDEPVVYPEHLTEELDYELELAVV